MTPKILLINPRTYAQGVSDAMQPLGLTYIAAVLLQRDYEVEILDARVLGIKPDGVVEHVCRVNPDYVGIYTALFNFKEATTIASKIRQKSDCRIIMGGPAASYHWQELLGFADYIVIGEGEVTIVELLERLEAGKEPYIPGVAYKRDGVPFRTEPREFIRDLDSLPFPAHHLLPDFKKYHVLQRRTPACIISTSRGCPYKCKFCFHGVFGYRYRMRSAENVVAELKYLVDRFGVRQISVADDNITHSRERARKIFQMVIDEGLDLLFNFFNGVRADTLDYDLLVLMKRAGANFIGLAPETGDPEIMKIIGKEFSLERVEQVVKWCKELGIMTQAFFLLGFPWETERNIRNTIDFAIKLDADITLFHILHPFKGTEVYEYAKEHGLIVHDTLTEMTGYGAGAFTARTETLSVDDLSRLRAEAYRRFYLRPGKFISTCIRLFPRSWHELSYYTEGFKNILKIVLRGGQLYQVQ